ncbi:hypothetical protein CEXT_141501 [Caerostris extrusa]|uniref:Endonuclease/exonuclease/phosphatase domain-containing protein n=1 Tax=Caerostris extrusa TaxID=172846 RepID=A0AAV4XTP7_CAEEX|nr:hypothetical protein CEXT_141501 [Caerostris extrusa]
MQAAYIGCCNHLVSFYLSSLMDTCLAFCLSLFRFGLECLWRPPKFEEIKEFISDHDIDIFMIQETYFNSNYSPGMANYTLHKINRPNAATRRTYGGTCIYVKN